MFIHAYQPDVLFCMYTLRVTSSFQRPCMYSSVYEPRISGPGRTIGCSSGPVHHIAGTGQAGRASLRSALHAEVGVRKIAIQQVSGVVTYGCVLQPGTYVRTVGVCCSQVHTYVQWVCAAPRYIHTYSGCVLHPGTYIRTVGVCCSQVHTYIHTYIQWVLL